MALKRIVGCDSYSDTYNDLPTSGAVRRLGASAERSFTSSGTRFSYGKRLLITGNANPASALAINIGAFAGNLIQGFSFKWDGSFGGAPSQPLGFIANVGGGQIAGIDLTSSGYLRAWGGAGAGGGVDAPLVATSMIEPMGAGDESFIEYEVGAAVFKVWRNGVLVIDYAGAIPANGTGATWADGPVDAVISAGGVVENGVQSGTVGNNGGSAFDDYYLLTTSGGLRTARLGNSRVERFLLDTEVANTGYVAVGGTNVLDRLNTNDGDTSGYTADADADIFVGSSPDTLTNNPVAIHGIGVSHVSRNTLAGATTVKTVLRIAATDYFGAGASLPSSYNQAQEIYEEDPDAAVDFTKSSLEGIDGFGVTIDQP